MYLNLPRTARVWFLCFSDKKCLVENLTSDPRVGAHAGICQVFQIFAHAVLKPLSMVHHFSKYLGYDKGMAGDKLNATQKNVKGATFNKTINLHAYS